MQSKLFRYWDKELVTIVSKFYAWIWNEKKGFLVGVGNSHNEAINNALNLIHN